MKNRNELQVSLCQIVRFSFFLQHLAVEQYKCSTFVIEASKNVLILSCRSCFWVPHASMSWAKNVPTGVLNLSRALEHRSLMCSHFLHDPMWLVHKYTACFPNFPFLAGYIWFGLSLSSLNGLHPGNYHNTRYVVVQNTLVLWCQECVKYGHHQPTVPTFDKSIRINLVLLVRTVVLLHIVYYY